jgi:hypothetical protein
MNRFTGAACVIAGLGITGLGCAVGAGDGEAKGPMFIEGCGDYKSEMPLAVFDLNPSFFAGEPVEDIRESASKNRLSIRLQRFGGGFEVNDVLQFDIVNSYEVARCVRGRQTMDPATGMMVPDYRTDICFWPKPQGPARVRVGPNDFVRATLTPFESCRSMNRPLNLVATAVPCEPVNGRSDCPDLPPEQWESFVEFQSFGATDIRDLPEDRSAIRPNFKVDFGQRIKVTRFVLELTDDHLLELPTGKSTQLKRSIFGHMEGWFDFDFDRGRAVQTFP